jgi:hypothetical protein
MIIDFKKLYTILENKTNKAIIKLDDLKCTTEEYKTTLDAILYNLEAFERAKKHDTECLDCKDAPTKQHTHKEEVKQERPIVKDEKPTSLVGKKWIPYKGEK